MRAYSKATSQTYAVYRSPRRECLDTRVTSDYKVGKTKSGRQQESVQALAELRREREYIRVNEEQIIGHTFSRRSGSTNIPEFKARRTVYTMFLRRAN